MINIDQLRISDDGQKLFIDAHVNRAEYFKNVYIDEITIATEDQVSGSCSQAIGDNYVYKTKISQEAAYIPLSKKPIVISGSMLTELEQENGGWKLDLTADTEEEKSSALSIQFTGKFSCLGTEGKAKLVVANSEYKVEDGIKSDDIFFIANGKLKDKDYDTSAPIWEFKGKGEVGETKQLYFYIFKIDDNKQANFVRLDETDNTEFLHFIYYPYAVQKADLRQEVHLVLSNCMFNEKFREKNLSRHMFFVWIKAAGTPDMNTPCRLDEATTIGVTFDYGLIYQNALCFTRELTRNCQVPSDFVNFILNYAALKLAIETEHYIVAIDYFKWLLHNGCNRAAGGKGPRPCGCH